MYATTATFLTVFWFDRFVFLNVEAARVMVLQAKVKTDIEKLLHLIKSGLARNVGSRVWQLFKTLDVNINATALILRRRSPRSLGLFLTYSKVRNKLNIMTSSNDSMNWVTLLTNLPTQFLH